MSRPALALLAAAALLVGCQHQFVPAPFGTPLDEACNPLNATLSPPLDSFEVGSALVPVTKGWSARYATAQDLSLTRIDAELNVWQGTRFLFPVLEPRNSVRCTVTRADTTITIVATRLNGSNYRVDASWQPLIAGQFFYMQLQTRYVEHLRQVRGIIEAVRFPPDSSTRKTK